MPRCSAVVERTTLCEAGFLTVERRHVAGPDGDEFDRHVVQHPGAVVVVPVDADGNALLVRQYRAAAGPRRCSRSGGQARRRRRAARGHRRA